MSAQDSHAVQPKTCFSDCTQSSKSKSTFHSKSCGNIDGTPARFAEAIHHAKTVLYPSTTEVVTSSSYSGSGEYYKRYDYDATPVRDDAMTSQTSTDSEKGERIPLTDSHLAKLEKNISAEINTDSSCNTLDSSIKFFKATVEEIFSKFYNNMQDFELYKKKFHEILSKDQESCVEEMEDFIKDMIHHIMSTESSDFNANHLCEVKNKKGTKEESNCNICSKLDDLECVMESFKNDNYRNESISNDRSSGSKQEWKDVNHSSETLSIYLMSKSCKNPCVSIKMNNNRNHLSEIKILDRATNPEMGKVAASVDNMKNLAANKLQIDMFETPAETCESADREIIPVKISFAKKNIHSDDGIHGDANGTEKSFMSKLCSFLCKKLRKAANMGM